MMGRWLNRFKPDVTQKTTETACAESAETPFCTNCTEDSGRISKTADDVTQFHNRLAQQVAVPFEWLAVHYFTPEDLTNIERGFYRDRDALGELIKTDMRYPFGWPDRGTQQ